MHVLQARCIFILGEGCRYYAAYFETEFVILGEAGANNRASILWHFEVAIFAPLGKYVTACNKFYTDC